MTIDEAKKELEIIESKVTALIQDYELKTKLSVDEIKIDRIRGITIDNIQIEIIVSLKTNA